jgi:hypothetical protein
VGSQVSQKHACRLGAYHRLETRSQRRPRASNTSQNLPQPVRSADVLSVDVDVTESVATIRVTPALTISTRLRNGDRHGVIVHAERTS